MNTNFCKDKKNNIYNWQGKKLLILGATKLLTQVVECAHKYGAKVIVIDYYENSPAKKIADESYLISTTDVDEICKLIKNKKIDGVLTGFMDSMLPYYKLICEKSNLPCYISNDEQLNFSTQKQIFKEYLAKFDIPYIKDIKYDESIEFPVIVKPVDNSGARGISICNNEMELNVGIENSLKFSKNKKYLIEKYYNFKEITVFYLFDNGNYQVTFVGDRHVIQIKDGFIKLPSGYTFPSRYTNAFLETLDKKFKSLFKKLEIKNGMMFIQCFVDNNEAIIPYEAGYRLTGSLEYILLDKICDYNPLAMMINFAFTGRMTKVDNELNKICPQNVEKCYNVSCLCKPGVIKEIVGVDKLKKQNGIIDIFESYEKGDILPEDAWGKLSQIGIRIFIRPKNDVHLELIYQKIKENLKIIDTKGNDMIINYKILP